MKELNLCMDNAKKKRKKKKETKTDFDGILFPSNFLGMIVFRIDRHEFT